MFGVPAEPPKLLDRVRQSIRTRHYSRRTEEAYAYWIRKYIVNRGGLGVTSPIDRL